MPETGRNDLHESRRWRPVLRLGGRCARSPRTRRSNWPGSSVPWPTRSAFVCFPWSPSQAESALATWRLHLAKSQPTISHHTKVLAEAGLLVGEKRGRWMWWRVEPSRLAAVRAALGRLNRGAIPSLAHGCASGSGGHAGKRDDDADRPGDEQSAHHAPAEHEEPEQRAGQHRDLPECWNGQTERDRRSGDGTDDRRSGPGEE